MRSTPPHPSPGRAVAFVAAALVPLAIACGPIASETPTPGVDAGGGDGGIVSVTLPPDDGTQFIAFGPAFAGFERWAHFDVLNAPALGLDSADGGVHPAGNRTVYVNHLPGAGQTAFAKGTVIVKTMPGDTLAMVKRGGEFNVQGAKGWEWFELVFNGSEWTIKWRGITPPAGFCYAGIAGGACNNCHTAFVANDFVVSGPLQLASIR
jgi:hypothetical protein